MDNEIKQRVIRFFENNDLREVRFIDEDGYALVENIPPMAYIESDKEYYPVIRAFVVGNDICIDLMTDDSMNEWEQTSIEECDSISQKNICKAILDTSF